MKKFTQSILVALLTAFTGSAADKTAANPEAMRSPVNQVFQFMHSGTFEYSVSNKVSATTYLWIPDHCRRLLGMPKRGWPRKQNKECVNRLRCNTREISRQSPE